MSKYVPTAAAVKINTLCIDLLRIPHFHGLEARPAFHGRGKVALMASWESCADGVILTQGKGVPDAFTSIFQ